MALGWWLGLAPICVDMLGNSSGLAFLALSHRCPLYTSSCSSYRVCIVEAMLTFCSGSINLSVNKPYLVSRVSRIVTSSNIGVFATMSLREITRAFSLSVTEMSQNMYLILACKSIFTPETAEQYHVLNIVDQSVYIKYVINN